MAKWVKYVGTSDVRNISARDWERADLKGQDPVVWNRGNGWTVDISKWSSEAQEAILSEPEMIEITKDLAEMEQQEAKRMPRDQRARSKEQRERREIVTAQTTKEGKTTNAKGQSE